MCTHCAENFSWWLFLQLKKWISNAHDAPTSLPWYIVPYVPFPLKQPQRAALFSILHSSIAHNYSFWSQWQCKLFVLSKTYFSLLIIPKTSHQIGTQFMHRNLNFKFISVRSLPLVLFYFTMHCRGFSIFICIRTYSHELVYANHFCLIFTLKTAVYQLYFRFWILLFFFNPSRKMSQKELSTKFRECLTSLIDFSEQWHSHSKEWDRGAE